MNLGEITCKNWESIDTESIARKVVKDIGYDRSSEDFCWDTFEYKTVLHAQSPDIECGIDKDKNENQGAGDQGMMFGYASDATIELMPSPIILAHAIMTSLTDVRKTGAIDYLRPDGKVQVSVFA